VAPDGGTITVCGTVVKLMVNDYYCTTFYGVLFCAGDKNILADYYFSIDGRVYTLSINSCSLAEIGSSKGPYYLVEVPMGKWETPSGLYTFNVNCNGVITNCCYQ
jgi:hypothetical protein